MTDNRDRRATILSLAVHELRTPVSVVAGYLRMVLKHFGEGLTDQQRKLLGDGERSCGHLAALLSDLSDLANLEAGHLPLRREPVALGALLTRLGSDAHEGAERGITLRVDACSEPAHVTGDPVRLSAALDALVTAVLRERADRTPMVVGCRLESGAEGRQVRLAIGDAGGIGRLMDDDERAAVPFDEYRGGMGFRIVLASRIIVAHGGRVASPVADRGRLAIVVWLPLSPDPEGSGPS